jgi:hypothetical protein
MKAICILIMSVCLASCSKGNKSKPNTSPKSRTEEFATSTVQPNVASLAIPKIEFLNGPENTEVDFPLSFKVRILDKDNKLNQDYNAPVTVAIYSGATVGFRSGTSTTVMAQNGEAEFKDLIIEKPGEYILTVQANGLAASSKPFSITPPQPKDVNLIFNGKSRTVKFMPPNILVDKDGEKFPVYDKHLTTFQYRGKNFRVEIKSPTEVHVTEFR